MKFYEIYKKKKEVDFMRNFVGFDGEFEDVKFNEDMYISELNKKSEEAERIIMNTLCDAATQGLSVDNTIEDINIILKKRGLQNSWSKEDMVAYYDDCFDDFEEYCERNGQPKFKGNN